MSQLLAVISILVLAVVVGGILLTQSVKETAQTDTGDCANLPQNRWRRHLDKPSRLAFRPTRFDRHSGNSRRAQRC